MTYSYDGASELTGIDCALGGAGLGNLTYAYDLAGRRMTVGGSFARSNVPAALAGASYNANNQMTQFGAAALAYDPNGNLTSDGTNTYTWNARNQLTRISGGVAASFQYDAFGRRVSKTLGSTTEYLYDGVNPVQELASGAESANLLTGLGVDEYFQRTDAGGSADFLTDALGSTLALTDSGGNTLASYTYEPFGNTTITGISANPFQYTGREDDGAGLYFYRARYYSAMFHRFVSEDPMGFLGGPNAYAYALDSPPNWVDRIGLNVTITQYYGQDGNLFGHIGISVNGNQTVGFDPCNTDACVGAMLANPLYVEPWYVPGEVDPIDPGRPVATSVEIPTTPQQDALIQNYINQRTANPGVYALVGRNCANFAESALQAGGVRTPSDILPGSLGRVNTIATWGEKFLGGRA